jgi:nucleotide-binding universal stress UspA family protein
MKTMVGKRILLASDFSPASRPAVREAITLARATGATLVIAHVLEEPIPFSPDGYVLPRIYDELAQAVRAQAQKKMQALLALARKAGVSASGLLLRGAPHEAIVRAARAHGARQIVVGTHGRSGVSRLILGSVAAKVVAAATCPTLVVPTGRKTGKR